MRPYQGSYHLGTPTIESIQGDRRCSVRAHVLIPNARTRYLTLDQGILNVRRRRSYQRSYHGKSYLIKPLTQGEFLSLHPCTSMLSHSLSNPNSNLPKPPILCVLRSFDPCNSFTGTFLSEPMVYFHLPAVILFKFFP